MEYDIWYIFCYSKEQYISALKRLKISINSVNCTSKIKILTWHKTLNKDIIDLKKIRKIDLYKTEKKVFSRSFFINLISKLIEQDKKYFYLADTDLFFHPEYFNWLDYICKKMNYKKNDLRIITNNFNIRPNKKYKIIPNKLFNLLSSFLPSLYNWEPPTELNEILKMDHMNAGFAHGCGLIPVDPLKEIGGYNEEIIGYGPEDDLFNKRLCFFSRVYYHKGGLRSSTFHIYHPKLNYQNKNKNWNYWNYIVKDINKNSIHSDYIVR
tara:strand:- start:137 stop:937 length:801 start_codon:yes stop_codon:yes gene_type:complete